MCKKHDDPTTDIKKIIQESTFLLNSILGKEYKAKLVDEIGNDLLNDNEEIAVFDKLNDLLNEQEKEFLNEKDIEHILINGKKVPDHLVKDAIDMLGALVYGED